MMSNSDLTQQGYLIPVILLSLILGLTMAGCKQNKLRSMFGSSLSPVIDGDWYRPEPLVTWQWQLSGTVNTGYDVDIYDIDLFDSSASLIRQIQASGKKVICYFSAGSYENWRSDAGQFPTSDLGNALDGWAGERWLDIRSSSIRSIMLDRLDLAVEKGCDGVEPDNVDAYSNNSGFDLTAADQLAFNRFISNQAHLRELSVGLKNDLDQIGDLVEYFDFAVNEECYENSECDSLTPFIDDNKAVLSAEYKSEYVSDATVRAAVCDDVTAMELSTLILPIDLDDSYRYSCL